MAERSVVCNDLFFGIISGYGAIDRTILSVYDGVDIFLPGNGIPDCLDVTLFFLPPDKKWHRILF